MTASEIDKLRLPITKIKPVLLWLIGTWLAYRLISNGIIKFDPDGMWTSAFDRWGYPEWFRILIGGLEVLGGALVILPRVRHYGAALLFLIMIGALATRIINGTSPDDAFSISFYAVSFLYLAAHHDGVTGTPSNKD